MNIFDYMNMVSGYIINKMENKRDLDSNIEFKISTKRENNELYYIIEESDFQVVSFYLKFPVASKQEFYEAFNTLLITYFKKSDILAYTAIKKDGNLKEKNFALTSKNQVSLALNIEDETDLLMFKEFKRYLDGELELEKESVTSLKKIPIYINEKIML